MADSYPEEGCSFRKSSKVSALKPRIPTLCSYSWRQLTNPVTWILLNQNSYAFHFEEKQLMKQGFYLWCFTSFKIPQTPIRRKAQFIAKNLHGLICSSAKEFYATSFQTLNTIRISHNEAYKERKSAPWSQKTTILSQNTCLFRSATTLKDWHNINAPL